MSCHIVPLDWELVLSAELFRSEPGLFRDVSDPSYDHEIYLNKSQNQDQENGEKYVSFPHFNLSINITRMLRGQGFYAAID